MHGRSSGLPTIFPSAQPSCRPAVMLAALAVCPFIPLESRWARAIEICSGPRSQILWTAMCNFSVGGSKCKQGRGSKRHLSRNLRQDREHHV